MTRLSPVSRRDLIRRRQILGFEGPYAGGNHEFMLRASSGHRLNLAESSSGIHQCRSLDPFITPGRCNPRGVGSFRELAPPVPGTDQ